MAQPADTNLLNSFLQEESERLTGIIDQKITPTSPWLSQIKKKTWPGEIGHIISNVMWERSFPVTRNEWTQYLSNATGDETNICLPNVDQVLFKQTVRTTNLSAKAIESPDFCVEDLRIKWKRDEQLGNVTRNLSQVTKDYNIRRNRNAYFGACDQKIIPTDAGFVTNDEADVVDDITKEYHGDALFADATPTSVMTHGMLDYLHVWLDREGGGQHGAAQSGGGHIYKLVTSAEHSRYLRKDTVSGIREDFRNSSHADVLLMGVGIEHTYNGYAHVIDPLPRRFEKHAIGADPDAGGPLAAGFYDDRNGWEEVMPWVPVDGAWVQNPLYASATFESGAILMTAVLDCFVPAPVSAVGKANFTPQNYQGEYKFNNIKDRVENPDGTIGYFRGKFVNGFQTRHPEFGVCFIHQRVPLSLEVDNVLA